jgi:hypothetical protein
VSRAAPVPALRVRAREVAALVGGAIAVLLLPAAHNLAASGEPIPTTSNWGVIFSSARPSGWRAGR